MKVDLKTIKRVGLPFGSLLLYKPEFPPFIPN